MTSKTANSVIRYLPGPGGRRWWTGSTPARRSQDVLGFGGDIPVVGSMAEGLARKPDGGAHRHRPAGRPAAGGVAGLAGRGARRRLRPLERAAHLPVRRSRPRRARPGRRAGRSSTCGGRPPKLPVAMGTGPGRSTPYVVLTVGTDCNVGKMTAQLQLVQGLEDRGLKTRFVATGQTGIFIEGWGTAVDAVVADFIAGAAEELVLRAAPGADIVLVEGQGSINHPGLLGVTLGLLHGSCPDAMILCHQATREYIGEYRGEPWLRIPPLSRLREAVRDDRLARCTRPR